jgi:hypothetical protein
LGSGVFKNYFVASLEGAHKKRMLFLIFHNEIGVASPFNARMGKSETAAWYFVQYALVAERVHGWNVIVLAHNEKKCN